MGQIGDKMSELGVGIVIGLIVWPFITLIDIVGKLIVNAIKATKSCGGDCRQGRDKCECKNNG